MEKIDNLDKKILSILSKNARIPFKDVAAECNVSRAAIHQRVQHRIRNRVAHFIRMSFCYGLGCKQSFFHCFSFQNLHAKQQKKKSASFSKRT